MEFNAGWYGLSEAAQEHIAGQFVSACLQLGEWARQSTVGDRMDAELLGQASLVVRLATTYPQITSGIYTDKLLNLLDAIADLQNYMSRECSQQSYTWSHPIAAVVLASLCEKSAETYCAKHGLTLVVMDNRHTFQAY